MSYNYVIVIYKKLQTLSSFFEACDEFSCLFFKDLKAPCALLKQVLFIFSGLETGLLIYLPSFALWKNPDSWIGLCVMFGWCHAAYNVAVGVWKCKPPTELNLKLLNMSPRLLRRAGRHGRGGARRRSQRPAPGRGERTAAAHPGNWLTRSSIGGFLCC